MSGCFFVNNCLHVCNQMKCNIALNHWLPDRSEYYTFVALWEMSYTGVR